MVHSKQTSPYVVSFIDVDMSFVVLQKKHLSLFLKKYGTKLTSKHFFLHAVAQLLFQFLWINALVNGDKIIVKKT